MSSTLGKARCVSTTSKPRRPPSKAIAIHQSTDGPAILRRVFSEPIEPDKDDLRDEVA